MFFLQNKTNSTDYFGVTKYETPKQIVKDPEDKPLFDKKLFLMKFVEKISCLEAINTCIKFGGRLITKEDLKVHIVLILQEKLNGSWLQSGNATCQNGVYDIYKGSKGFTVYNNDTITKIQSALCLISEDQIYYLKRKNDIHALHPIPNSHQEYKCLHENCELRWFPNENIFKLVHARKNTIFAQVFLADGSHSLIGGHIWYRPTENMSEWMIFSTCTNSQFTCSSGICIQMEKVCDYMYDCDDGIDEKLCTGEIKPSNKYHKLLAPESANGQMTSIYLSVRLSRIVEIKTEENTLKINLKLLLIWKDLRLNFLNLWSNHSNIFQEKIAKEIWQPKVFVTNAIDDDRDMFYFQNLHAKLSATKIGKGTPEVANGYEGWLRSFY